MTKLTKILAVLAVAAPLAALAEDAKGPAVKLSGTADAYYLLNLDMPQTETNIVRAAPYEGRPGFNLNYAKVGIDADAGDSALKLDLAFAPQSVAVSNFFVQQAYAQMKFGKATVGFGRFVTPAGFEVFETKDNWFGSRGLIYSWAVPTAHEGVRVAFPLTEELTLTAYLANGNDLFSNDTGGNQSPYKTGILSGVYAKDDLTAALNIFFTKDPNSTEDGYLIDAVVTKGFGDFTLNVSGDYGALGSGNWMAIGASGKMSIAEDKFRLVARAEYFDDPDGVRTGAVTGVNVFEVTVGANMPVGSNSELRAEVRLDSASEDIFGTVADPSGTATTFQVTAIAWF